MNRFLRLCALTVFVLPASDAFASYHTFRIEQIYSNADGSVQFVVMHEAIGADGESLWTNHTFTSTRAGITNVYRFPRDLPGAGQDNGYGATPSPTANKRVLIATQGFAALGISTPDYVIPNGFLPTNGGTVNYADVDQVTFSSLPTDGTHAIDRNGAVIPNLATNFAGQIGSVAAAATGFTPTVGLWWNPDESGTGYNFDVKHGVLVVTMYTYDANGLPAWYLAVGSLTDNGTRFAGTLDKYRNGQCVSPGCPYRNPGAPVGIDGPISITFTSGTSATVTLPGRVTAIQPLAF